VLLQILGTLERLSTKITLVRLEWYMNSDMRCDVVALDGGNPALRPLTLQVQVIGALATDMLFADVLLIKS